MNPHLGKWKYNAGEYKARSGQASSHWQGRCCVALVCVLRSLLKYPLYSILTYILTVY